MHDRQQAHVGPRKAEPRAVLAVHFDAFAIRPNRQAVAPFGQQRGEVQLVALFFRDPFQDQKVDDVAVRADRSAHRDCGPVGMPVQRLAKAVKGDEVSRGETQLFLSDGYAENAHGPFLTGSTGVEKSLQPAAAQRGPTAPEGAGVCRLAQTGRFQKTGRLAIRFGPYPFG